MARWLSAIAILFLLLCIALFVSFKTWEKRIQFSYVPEGMGVNKILYVEEESWGFGPGGNETGVIVYELPDSVSREIQRIGPEYFANLPPQSGNSHDWHGRYDKWDSTPLTSSKDWFDAEGGKNLSPKSVPKIANYLNKYGFGIPIEPQIENDINEALSKPGSYFAYGRIGILIVVPETHRVIYAYNG